MSAEPAIILVTSSFPIQGNGSEAAGAFVADLAEEIAKHVPVRVVAPGTSDSHEIWSSDVDVYRYATPDRPLSTLRLWHPLDALLVLQVMRDGEVATERAVTAGPVAHLVALWALPCGEWARRSAKRYGLDYSVWTLGSDIWSLGRIPVVRSRLRKILRHADSCWSDGIKLAQDTRDIAGREIGFLPSTRRIDRVRIDPLREKSPYRLLFLGRWHPNKGVDLLLAALRQLTDEDWRLIELVTIAGGGPLEAILNAGVRELQENGRPVTLRGYLGRDEAQAAILDADYLLIPSRVESIPLVFSDAMKLGCPVIATPVGDLPVLMKSGKSCGILATAVNAEAYIKSIRIALRMSPLRYKADLDAIVDRFKLPACAHTLLKSVHT